MTFELVGFLLLGVTWIAVTAEILVRTKTIFVPSLLLGATFLTLGVLGFMGLIAPEWLPVFWIAGNGISLICASPCWRGTPAHTNWPKWTGAVLVFGCGACGTLCGLFWAWYRIV